MTKAKVIKMVGAAIKRNLPKAPIIAIDIVNEDVWPQDDWWHVPVRAKPEQKGAYPLYDLLSDIEIELLSRTGLNVVLVPAVPAGNGRRAAR